MIRRAITVTGGVNISKQIRGPALKRDVMLTVCPDGIVVSPCRPQDAVQVEECDPYVAKSSFNQYNRLYIPHSLCEAAHIGRLVQVAYRPDGTLLLTPDHGDFCMMCGSEEDLQKVGRDQLLCYACIKKMYNSSTGGRDEE